MKIEEIKTIVKLMSENDLTEFKIEADSCNLCIRRGGNSVVATAPVVQTVAAAPVVAAPVAEAPVAEAPKAETVAEGTPVESPLVGTFYRSPSPDSPFFVNVGDSVTPDTVIGIIEAMKVMNEVKAEKSGVIKEILAENGQPVEFGQAIMIIG